MVIGSIEYKRTVEEIYESVVSSYLWPRTLDHLAALTNAEGVLLYMLDGGQRFVSSAKSFSDLVRREQWLSRNNRDRQIALLKDERFLTEEDIFPDRSIVEFPFYRDVLLPNGLGRSAVTMIRLQSGDRILLSVERAYEKGPFHESEMTLLNDLRQHVERAANLAANAGLSHARLGISVLENIGLPAAVISSNQKILLSNDSFSRMAIEAINGIPGGIKFYDLAAQANFSRLMAVYDSMDNDGTASGSFILRSRTSDRLGIGHLVPLGVSEFDIFTGAAAIFFITPLGAQTVVSVEFLRGLFDLTLMEAKIARLIGSGSRISDVSISLGIQASTVRVHLKSIFFKMDINRQSELVRLVMLPVLKS